MLIAFVGDVHGCVHQCLAALLRIHAGTPLGAIIQVGDLGAWPDVSTMFAQDPPSKWFAEDNPRTLDWFELIDPTNSNAAALRRARDTLGQPIRMICGNHDDRSWLRPGSIDAFDIFHLVPDGTVMELDELRVGFLGGIEVNPDWPPQVQRYAMPYAFGAAALDRLRGERLDVLVTHDGPYAIASNWRGDTQGSRVLTELVEVTGARWHVAGHYHISIGPQQEGAATYLGLSCLVHPLVSRWDTDRFDPTGCVQASGIAVFDTADGSFRFPPEEEMRKIDKHLDLKAWV